MGDIRTTEGEDMPLTRRQKRRRLWRWVTGLLTLAAVLIVTGLLVKVERFVEAPGYVTTEDFAEVRPATTGQVQEILVHSGSIVQQGDVLVRLAAPEEMANLAEANSLLRRLQADLARREAEIAQARRQHAWDITESRYLLEAVQLDIARIGEALASDTSAAGNVSAEMVSLELARNEARRTNLQLVRRDAEIADLRRQRESSIAEADLLLRNAKSDEERVRQLVESKLAAATALADAQLAAELAAVRLTALKSRDESVYDKELAVLRQELQSKQDAIRQAEARLRQRLSELALQEKLAQLRLTELEEADLTIYDKELQVKQQEIEAAEQAVNRVKARLAATEVRAPIAGQVLRYEFVIGELVRPDTLLMEIFGGEKQVLKLRIAERYATRVAPEQRYRAELSIYQGLRKVYFTGQVNYLRNAIQTEGQNTYRVAYCSFDPNDHVVPPGTSAEARIYYGYSNLWFYLFGLD